MPKVVYTSVGSSTVAASPLIIDNDGVESTTITVTVRNTEGNPMPNLPVTLAITAGTGTLAQPAAVTDASGQATGSLVSSTIGTVTVKATVTGVDVTQTASVEVTSSSFTLGAGPNAPTWSGETVYTEEIFETPIPVIYTSANAAGFQGRQGFDGSYGGNVYDPIIMSYPVVSTPLGTKPVLQVRYPGYTYTIDANGETTTAYPTSQNWAVRVTGTWVGTLAFEIEDSVGSGTFSAFTMTGVDDGASGTATSVTANGTWASQTSDQDPTYIGRTFRVRATSWTSGTATVVVGVKGGAAPGKFLAGTWGANTNKFYYRYLVKVSANFLNGENSGTKIFFWDQTGGQNSYIALSDNGSNEGYAKAYVRMQGAYTQTYENAGNGPAHGTWLDCEFLVIGGTPGSADGTIKLWINNVNYIDETNVQVLPSGHSGSFAQFLCDPTYGGGFRPPPNDQNWQVAGVYRKGAPA